MNQPKDNKPRQPGKGGRVFIPYKPGKQTLEVEV